MESVTEERQEVLEESLTFVPAVTQAGRGLLPRLGFIHQKKRPSTNQNQTFPKTNPHNVDRTTFLKTDPLFVD